MSISIIYDDHRTVRLDSFHVSRTYGGALEGLPKPEQVYESARKRLGRLWGDARPVLLRESPVDENGFLPSHICMAWLNSDALEDGVGSHLFLIWFTEIGAEPIPILCMDALDGVEWDQHAKDWWP